MLGDAHAPTGEQTRRVGPRHGPTHHSVGARKPRRRGPIRAWVRGLDFFPFYVNFALSGVEFQRMFQIFFFHF